MTVTNELSQLSISEARAGLISKKFSAVELTEAAIKTAERAKDLNLFIEFTPELAIEDAETADRLLRDGNRAALLGIPLGLKDIIVTRGVRTTAGSGVLKNFIPPYDATVVRKLKAAGTVFLGKFNMDEFAMGSSSENPHFGPVKNPWNPKLVAGGSSGGSAAAVASGLCRVSFGTDTGGSIRQPAAFCGVIGIRPTYGRVSRFGVITYASSLDQVGAFGRTVEDAAQALEVISGKDPNDATSIDLPVPAWSKNLSTPLEGLRIGVPREYFIQGLHPDISKALEEVKKRFESLGAMLVDISLPHTGMAVPAYYIIAPAEASSNLARYDGVRFGHRASDAGDLGEMYRKTRSEGFGPEVQRRILVGTYVLSSGYYDAYYLKAQKVRTLIKRDFTDAFEKHCDLIFAPTTPSPPFKIGAKIDDPVQMYLEDIFTVPLNLAGLPGLSFPCGVTADGLPIGGQLIGRPWDEQTILSVAHAYESVTEWHKRSPVLG